MKTYLSILAVLSVIGFGFSLNARSKNTSSQIYSSRASLKQESSRKSGISTYNFSKNLPTLTPNIPVVSETLGARICREALAIPGSLQEKLASCAWLANRIVWETGDGYKVSYYDWTPIQKRRLEILYTNIVSGEADLGVNCPNLDPVESGGNRLYRRIFLSQDQAFDIYAAHVAHALYLEINHLVPWSLLSLPDNELSILLSSDSYHARILPDPGNYPPYYNLFRPNRDFQQHARLLAAEDLDCDPRVGYRFMTGVANTTHTNLIGDNEEETIKNISWWFYLNVSHYPSNLVSTMSYEEWGNNYVHLKDRLTRKTFRDEHTVFAFMGCHSAANLFFELARSVNIPIQVALSFNRDIRVERSPLFIPGFMSRHSGLVFRHSRENPLVLNHADDLYTNLRPFFAVTDDRVRLDPTSREAKELFFKTVWRSPAELAAVGFTYQNFTPPLNPGDGNLSSRSTGYPFYGYFLGYWNDPLLNGLNQGYDVYFSRYKLCTYTQYAELYCSNNDALRSIFEEDVIERRSAMISFPDAYPSTAEQFMSRAAECVSLYGGCDALRSQAEHFMAGFAGTTFLDVH